MCLLDLEIGKKAIVDEILTDASTRKRLYNLGLYKGVIVTVIRFAPLGCPVEIKVKDFFLAIRVKDAKNVKVRTL